MKLTKCNWCLGKELYEDYHDTEWGVPKTEDRELFELLVLESFQAGLNWYTILKKRDNFRLAFAEFEIQKVALFTSQNVSDLLLNEGIIRHKGKIEAAINNAKLVLAIQKKHSSLSNFLWKYVDYTPIQNKYTKLSEVPSQTETSLQLSKDLKQMGFKFLGPTTTYAFMQASGMVNDHLVSCFRHHQVSTKD